MQKNGLRCDILCYMGGSECVEQNMLDRNVSGMIRKFWNVVSWLNFLVQILVIRLSVLRIVELSSVNVMMNSGVVKCIGINQIVMMNMLVLIVSLCIMDVSMYVLKMLWYDSGGSSMNMRLLVIFDWISDDELFVNVFCSMFIIMRFGMRKFMYLMFGQILMWFDSVWLKIVRYSSVVMIGVSIVWNDIFQKCSSFLQNSV